MTSPSPSKRRDSFPWIGPRDGVLQYIRGVDPSRLYSVVTIQETGHPLMRNEWTLIGTSRSNSMLAKAPMWTYLSRLGTDLDTANEACTPSLHPGANLHHVDSVMPVTNVTSTRSSYHAVLFHLEFTTKSEHVICVSERARYGRRQRTLPLLSAS